MFVIENVFFRLSDNSMAVGDLYCKDEELCFVSYESFTLKDKSAVAAMAVLFGAVGGLVGGIAGAIEEYTEARKARELAAQQRVLDWGMDVSSRMDSHEQSFLLRRKDITDFDVGETGSVGVSIRGSGYQFALTHDEHFKESQGLLRCYLLSPGHVEADQGRIRQARMDLQWYLNQILLSARASVTPTA